MTQKYLFIDRDGTLIEVYILPFQGQRFTFTHTGEGK